jgi:hypothetical protein
MCLLNLRDIDLAHYQIWLSKLANKKVTTIPKLKTLSPTSEAFTENVKRAHLQVCIWKTALDEDPPDLDASDFGWIKDESSASLSPVTVSPEIPTAPPGILQMIRCGCSSDQPCSTGICGCHKGQLTCTVFCACNMDRNCQNQWTKYATQTSDEESGSDDEDNAE